jgi:hypothetical protein
MNVYTCRPRFASWLRQSLFDLWPVVIAAAAIAGLLTNESFGTFYRQSSHSIRVGIIAIIVFVALAVCRYSLSMLHMSWEVHSAKICFDSNAIWNVTRFGTPRIPWATLEGAELHQRKNLLSGTDRMLILKSKAPEFIRKDGQIERWTYPFVLHTSTLSEADEAAILKEVGNRCEVVRYENEPAL